MIFSASYLENEHCDPHIFLQFSTSLHGKLQNNLDMETISPYANIIKTPT